MTTLIKSFTGTENLIVNVIAVLAISLIGFCLVAFVCNLDMTILNRAF